ncbi:MAG: DUF3466 family protein [Phycisphaerae bacterium]|nr:DUF3466 family protein [Phycisphaerae bacterium]
MKGSHTLVRWFGMCLAAAALATTATAQDGNGLVLMYELTELVLDDGGQTRAYAVNDTGQVIGWVELGELRHSAHWHNEVATDLHGTVHFELKHPLFDQDWSECYDISNADQIVGTARTEIKCPAVTFVITNAFILRPAVLSDLATPYPGDALINLWTFGNPCNTAYDSVAVGISNTNHVVGWADLETGVIHAFLVTPSGGNFFDDTGTPDGVNDLMVDLGTLATSDPVSSASAVNDQGQVTGYTYTIGADGRAGYHAFLVTPNDTNGDGVGDQWFVDGGNGVNTLMGDLQTLGGTNSWGRDINNLGQVVGESDFDAPSGAHYTQAFLWSGGQMTSLGTFRDDPATGFSAASALNEKGAIVGWAENEDRRRRAFRWENGQMKDLNDLLYLLDDEGNAIIPSIVLTEARDINEDGVIVGWGTVRGSNGGEDRGFLLNPTLVDPSVFEEDETDGNSDDTQNSNGDATGGYTAEPIFGLPDHLKAGTNGDESDEDDAAEEDVVVAPPVPALCGSGTLAFLPLTLAGLCRMKAGRHRK